MHVVEPPAPKLPTPPVAVPKELELNNKPEPANESVPISVDISDISTNQDNQDS